MQTNAFQVWGIRLATLMLAALAALSGTYWALKSTHANSASGAAPAAGFAALDPMAVARAFGGGGVAPAGAPVAPSTAYNLVGVLGDQRQHGGAALISVDGKAAKPYRVGATVEGSNLVLQSVEGRRAVLAAGMDGPAQLTLELPPLSK